MPESDKVRKEPLIERPWSREDGVPVNPDDRAVVERYGGRWRATEYPFIKFPRGETGAPQGPGLDFLCPFEPVYHSVPVSKSVLPRSEEHTSELQSHVNLVC